jgi:hypothetical protein
MLNPKVLNHSKRKESETSSEGLLTVQKNGLG